MSEIRYPMRVVTQRTGLSSHVVRVWERRYGAVTPDRSGSNRRLYSEQELHRLGLMATLTRHGHCIGQIAALATQTLEEMAEEQASALDSSPAPAGDRVDDALEEAWRAIESLDSAGLQQVLDAATLEGGGAPMIEKLLVPLIGMIGERWEDGTISTAQEQVASAIIKDTLLQASRPHSETRGAPDLTVATPAGQLHELGAALVASTARRRGWSVTYLGASLPPEEIASAARLKRSLAVALSIVYPGDDPSLPADLIRLRQLLPDDCEILAGGRSTAAYAPALREIGAVQLDGLDQLKQWLDEARIGRQLNRG